VETKTVVRIGAIGFAATVVTVSMVDAYTASPDRRSDDMTQVAAPPADDPLLAELLRCQAIGQAGATDAACLGAWAANRRRFFLQPGVAGADQPRREVAAPAVSSAQGMPPAGALANALSDGSR
jgi:conjugative transfer region protein TrbK